MSIRDGNPRLNEISLLQNLEEIKEEIAFRHVCTFCINVFGESAGEEPNQDRAEQYRSREFTLLGNAAQARGTTQAHDGSYLN